MNTRTHPPETLQLADLRPGLSLIDTDLNRERVIARVELYSGAVRLFFQGEADSYTYPLQELQTRFRIVSDAFRADPQVVSLIAEAHRLQHAYLFNPIFATETSLIDPLPHQFIAVYEHLLKQNPLRFLLADDAGAGKTIMTGLYIQDILLRRQVERILIVPPAGLVGNWERELRVCFRLQFRILSGSDAAGSNPFADPRNRLAIVSLDTLRQERMQAALFEARPYQLVVFDEAHKLSARYETDGTIEKSKRYALAEKIAAQQKNLLLLTATPHMGRDDAYYFLWRLLLPEYLAAQEAFNRFSEDEKSKHLLRRMKEEMVTFDGKPIYPPRRSQTIAYPLKQGSVSEQALYDAVTDYCETYFDLAGQYNRSAAKMAMMVLQRRLASSTYALWQSLIRRGDKLQATLDDIQAGAVSDAQLEARQGEISAVDIRAEKTADEEDLIDGKEESEQADEALAAATAARSVSELQTEIDHVQRLTELARQVYGLRSESKFEKLWDALREYPDTKVLIFTEHRDTMNFVIERLEALGATGRVAQIHGGMKYSEREEQVAFFRDTDGAQYLVATDAAGEGINLQFCWLMVNYDVPWNPARLEQRMGRIHRYKQTRTVVLLNLIAEDTREGRVLKVLLEKLEKMREELDDDKVFDVIGKQFRDIALKDLITEAIAEDKSDASIRAINAQFTPESVREHLESQRTSLISSDIRGSLGAVQKQRDDAQTLRMLPAYVRSFFVDTVRQLGCRIDGDVEKVFKISNCPESVRTAMNRYPEGLRDRLTFSRESALPTESETPAAIFLHPGEPVFEAIRTCFLEQFSDAAAPGAVYLDPQADEPYLFYLASVPVVRQGGDGAADVLDEICIGIKRFSDGRCEEVPAHLLLTVQPHPTPKQLPETLTEGWLNLAGAEESVKEFVSEEFGAPRLSRIRADLRLNRENRLKHIRRSARLREGELLQQRNVFREAVKRGVPAAQTKLRACDAVLDELPAQRAEAEARLTAAIENTTLGPVTLCLRAFVTPMTDTVSTKTLRDTEAIAIDVVRRYESGRGADVKDVSAPHLKRGFDLESIHPSGEVRYIEVKGRSGLSQVTLTENEWRQAVNHGERYWLYVVYYCDTEPQLYLCQDPFAKLIAKPSGQMKINASDIIRASESPHG